MKSVVRKQPNWLLETLTLIAHGFGEKEGYPMDFVTNPAVYNMTREELGEKLGTTVTYLRTVFDQTREILRQYPDLEPYNESFCYGCLPLVSFNIDSSSRLYAEDFKKALYYHALLERVELEEDEEKIQFDSEANISNMLSLLSKTSSSDTDKMKLLTLFQMTDQSFDRIKEMLCKVEEVLVQNFGIIEEKYNNAVSMYAAGDGKEAESALKRHINQFDYIEASDLDFQVSIAHLNSLHLYSPLYEKNKLYTIMGIDFELLARLKQEANEMEERPLNWAKAFADSNKMKIIRMLAQRPMFLREISDALGVSGATTSHHLKQMIDAKLLKFKISGRKIYYTINAEEFEKIASILLKIAGMSRERENDDAGGKAGGPDK
ncbi:MAG: helix-turn-helix transcriptional regulator [Clostridiales bacterium]|nr:helix-turn-helix transcriptional regulator [Clostridiales bacterium]